MFYVEHGTLRTNDNGTEQIFDAITYQWKILDKGDSLFKFYSFTKEWNENNCHPNGYFKCPRCYRKHNVPDNFDLLCDGCSEALLEYENFSHIQELKNWNVKDNTALIQERLCLRDKMDQVFKSESLSFENKPITILKDMLDNKGNLKVSFTEDLSKPFVINSFNIQS